MKRIHQGFPHDRKIRVKFLTKINSYGHLRSITVTVKVQNGKKLTVIVNANFCKKFDHNAKVM